MVQTVLAEFSAAWRHFIHFPLPAFLSGDGERSAYRPIDGHPALLRIMMPLLGFVLGLFIALPLWGIGLLFPGRLISGMVGMTLVPLVLELAMSWEGLTALANFIDLRRQGVSLDDALAAAPAGIGEPRSGSSMILMMTVYLVRMIFCGVLAIFVPFWFMMTLCGAWLVRAELASLSPADGNDGLWLAVPRGLGKHHWYAAAGAMLAGGFLHPVGLLLAFAVSWAYAALAKNLCRETASGVSRQMLNIFGYGAEFVLMFLGILLYASV